MGPLPKFLQFLAFALALALAGSASASDRLDLSCPEHKNAKGQDPKYADKIIASEPSCVKHGELINETRKKHAEFIKRQDEAAKKYSSAAVVDTKDTVTALTATKSMLESTAKEFREIAAEAEKAAKKLNEERPPNEQALKSLNARKAELERIYGENLKVNRDFNDATHKLMLQHAPESTISERKQKLTQMTAENERLLKFNNKGYYARAMRDQSLAIKTSKFLADELKSVHDNNISKAEQVEAQAARIKPGALASEQDEKFKAAIEKGEKLPLDHLKDKPVEQKGFFSRMSEKVTDKFSSDKLPISPEVEKREETLKELLHTEAQPRSADSSSISEKTGEPKKNFFDEDVGDGPTESAAKLGARELKGDVKTGSGSFIGDELATAENANANRKAEYQASLEKNGGSEGLAKTMAGPVASKLEEQENKIVAARAEYERTKVVETTAMGDVAMVTENPEARAKLDKAYAEYNQYTNSVCSDVAQCNALKDSNVPMTRSMSEWTGAHEGSNNLKNIAEVNAPHVYQDPLSGDFSQPAADTRPKAIADGEALQMRQAERQGEMDARVESLRSSVAAQQKLEAAEKANQAAAIENGMGPIVNSQMVETSRRAVIAQEAPVSGAVAAVSGNLDDQADVLASAQARDSKLTAMNRISMAGGPTGAVGAYMEMKDAEATSNWMPKNVEAYNKYQDSVSNFKTETAMFAAGGAVTAGTGSVMVDSVRAMRLTDKTFERAAVNFGGDAARTEYSVASSAASDSYSVAPKGYSYDALTSSPQVNYAKTEEFGWANSTKYDTKVDVSDSSYGPVGESTVAKNTLNESPTMAEATVAKTSTSPKAANDSFSTPVAANSNDAPIAMGKKFSQPAPETRFSDSAAGWRATSVNNAPIHQLASEARAVEQTPTVQVAEQAPVPRIYEQAPAPRETPDASRSIAEADSPRVSPRQDTQSYTPSNDNYRTTSEPAAKRAYNYDEPAAAAEPAPRNFFQRQADRISNAGASIKQKLMPAAPEPAPTKWRVATSAEQNTTQRQARFVDEEAAARRTRELDATKAPEANAAKPAEQAEWPSGRRLSERFDETHPSQNPRALLRKAEENFGIELKPKANGAAYEKAGHNVLMGERYLAKGNEIEGKGVAVHELHHMTTNVKDARERMTEFKSESGSLHDGDQRVGYNRKSVGDESDARRKQLASERLDRLRNEQKLAETKDTGMRDDLIAKIKESERLEARELKSTRAMIAEERQINEDTLAAIREKKASTYDVAEGYEGRDAFELKYKDANGEDQVFKGFVKQYQGKADAAAKQLADIKTAVIEKLGDDSPAAKVAEGLKPDSKELTWKRDAVPYREYSPKSRETGRGDISSTLMDPKTGTEEEMILRRQKQLDAAEAHLNRHYGSDPDKPDFSWRPAAPNKTSSAVAESVLTDLDRADNLSYAASRLEAGEKVNSVALVHTDKKTGLSEINVYNGDRPGIAATIKADRNLSKLPPDEMRQEIKRLISAEADRLGGLEKDLASTARERIADSTKKPGLLAQRMQANKEAAAARDALIPRTGKVTSDVEIPVDRNISLAKRDWAEKNGLTLHYDPEKEMFRVLPGEGNEISRAAAHLEKRHGTELFIDGGLRPRSAGFVNKGGGQRFMALNSQFLTNDRAAMESLNGVIAHETQHVATDTRSYFILNQKDYLAHEGEKTLENAIPGYKFYYANDEVQAYYAGGRRMDLDALKLEKEGKAVEAARLRADAQQDYGEAQRFLEASRGPSKDLEKDLRSGKLLSSEGVREDGSIVFDQVQKGPVVQDLKNHILYRPGIGEVEINRELGNLRFPIAKNLEPGQVQQALLKHAVAADKKSDQWERLINARRTEEGRAAFAKRVAEETSGEPAGLMKDRVANYGKRAVADDAQSVASKADKPGFLQRVKGKLFGAKNEMETPAVRERRQLSAMAEDHPSRNVDNLLDRIEQNYGVGNEVIKQAEGEEGMVLGRWQPGENKIKLREEFHNSEYSVDGKRVTVHEANHMTTNLKGRLEQATEFRSASENNFGGKVGGYGKYSRADEVDSRVKELGSLRADRKRIEQRIAKMEPGAARSVLEQEVKNIQKVEDYALQNARNMLWRERELNARTLGRLSDSSTILEPGPREIFPGSDRMVYRFKDAQGNEHTFRSILPQRKGLDLEAGIEARGKDILAAIEKKYGANSDAMRAVSALKEGDSARASLSIQEDAIKEKQIRSFAVYTGVDDVAMKGYLNARKLPSMGDASFQSALRQEAIKSIERRQKQLDARAANLDKHYGRDGGHYDFGSAYHDEMPSGIKTIESDSGAARVATGENDMVRPWGEELPRGKQTPYAERMEKIYGVHESPVRDPAAVPNPERKMQHLADEHSQFKGIGPDDNKNFIKLAEAANAGEPTELKMAASMQAAIGKFANDVMIKNKDVVNQVFNLQKTLIWDKVSKDPLLSKHLIGQYSDFNTVRLAFNSNDKAITKRLTEVYSEYNSRYAEYMDKVAKGKGWDQKAMGLAEHRENWHHLGIGSTPDEANLAARKSREMFDENGIARARTYEEVKGAVADDLDAIEKRRVELENKFGDTKGMFVGEKGDRVLSAEANEAIRKAEQTDAGVKKAIEKQFGTKLSDSEVAAFRDYVNKADSFSPDLYVAERIDVPLDARRNGVVSADFKGQNARNLEESMKAMVANRGKSIEEQVRAIRAGEADATRVLESKKSDFRQAVKEQFGKADPEWEKHIYFTGDDGIYLPAKKLSAEDKAAFASRFSEKPDNLRLTFGQSHFADTGKAIPRDALSGQKALSDFVVDAEKVEKDLRKGLMAKFQRDVTNNTQLVVDAVPRSDGTKSIGVYIGGKHTPEQMQQIQAWTQKYLRSRGDDLSFVKELGAPRKSTNDVIADAIWASKMEPERIGKAEKLLGRTIDEGQRRAIMNAHFVGEGENTIGNYTKNQIAEKARILDQGGFTVAERRKLMEAGIAGDESKGGIRLEYDTRTGDSKIGRTPAGAEVVKVEPAPKTMAEARQRWLEGGEQSDIEEYGKSVPPEEAVAEYRRLAALRSPQNMPASPGEAYYQQQVNYLMAQKELVSSFENEDAFGGLEKTMDMQFKLDAELKKNQTALKNAIAQKRP